jgi:hypothetical protein
MLLHVGEHIDEGKKPAQDEQGDSNDEQRAELQNDCPPHFHHNAILAGAASLRNSVAGHSNFR